MSNWKIKEKYTLKNITQSRDRLISMHVQEQFIHHEYTGCNERD